MGKPMKKVTKDVRFAARLLGKIGGKASAAARKKKSGKK